MTKTKTAILILMLCFHQTASFEYLKLNTAFTPTQVTTYAESNGGVVELTNGIYVIVYHSSTATTSSANNNMYYNVYVNVFDSTGKLLTPTQLTSNSPSYNQSVYPSICSDGAGGFVVAWEERDGATFSKVHIRHFDPTFTPGSIITANTNTAFSFYCATSVSLLMNGNYVVFWTTSGKVYAQIYDSNFKTVGSNISVQDTSDTYTQQTYWDPPIALSNSGFMLVWNNKNSNDIIAKFFDKTGVATTQEITVNTNNTTGIQTNPHASILTGGNIVVVWVDINANKIVARLLGQDGTSVGTFINCNTSTNVSLDHPRAFSLISGGFGVVWHAQNGSTLSVFFQIFDKDGNKLGQETMVNTDTSINNSSPYGIEHSKTGNLIFTWDVGSNQGDVTAQMFYKNDGMCKDIQISLGGQSSVTIDFSAITYANIYLTTLPTIGQLKDGTQKALVLSTFVDKTKVFYVTTGQNPDSFTYATNTVDPSCKVTITACYQTCLTCTGMGDATNNNCLQCAPNLYKMSDNPNNCYSNADIPQGYYLDTSTKTYTKCYISCLTCANGGDISNNNCSTCAKNYYNLEDKLSQCYLSADTVIEYFFNIINDNFTKCFNSCNTCKLLGNINQHLCLTCKNNFFPLEDNALMCYSKDSSVPGYYLDFPNSIFKKCYKSCSQCSGPGDIYTTNCTQCAPDYTICTDCTTIVYKDSCVDSCPPLAIYNATSKTCTDCGAGEVVFNNQCIFECPTGYVQNSNTCVTCIILNLYYYKTTCVEQCPDGSILNTATNTCDIYCGLGYYINNFSCLTCQSDNKLVFEGNCVDKCPVGYIQDNEGLCNLIKTNNDTACAGSTCNGACAINVCLNSGVCSIQYNKATCTCVSTFIGQYCQIAGGNIEKINSIISNLIIII
jgi:hypothetical protein